MNFWFRKYELSLVMFWHQTLENEWHRKFLEYCRNLFPKDFSRKFLKIKYWFGEEKPLFSRVCGGKKYRRILSHFWTPWITHWLNINCFKMNLALKSDKEILSGKKDYSYVWSFPWKWETGVLASYLVICLLASRRIIYWVFRDHPGHHNSQGFSSQSFETKMQNIFYSLSLFSWVFGGKHHFI